MEDIFIIQLAERAKSEAGLIDQLPEDVRILVEEKLANQSSENTEHQITEE
jgi:hypothetical protein